MLEVGDRVRLAEDPWWLSEWEPLAHSHRRGTIVSLVDGRRALVQFDAGPRGGQQKQGTFACAHLVLVAKGPYTAPQELPLPGLLPSVGEDLPPAPVTMDLPEIALSVRQPWAWAIIHAGKDIENRGPSFSFDMPSRRFAVHASQGMTRQEYEDARDYMAEIGVACPRPDALVRGAIIGAVTVTSVVGGSDSPWFFGPRGLVLTEPVAVDPVPASGALGFFRWSPAGALAKPKPWMSAWCETEAGVQAL